MEYTGSKAVYSNKVAEAIKDVGLLPDECKRMVIDIQAGEAVKVYYECYGSEKVIELLRNPEVVISIKQAQTTSLKPKTYLPVE